jgi:hypothetical protein
MGLPTESAIPAVSTGYCFILKHWKSSVSEHYPKGGLNQSLGELYRSSALGVSHQMLAAKATALSRGPNKMVEVGEGLLVLSVSKSLRRAVRLVMGPGCHDRKIFVPCWSSGAAIAT